MNPHDIVETVRLLRAFGNTVTFRNARTFVDDIEVTSVIEDPWHSTVTALGAIAAEISSKTGSEYRNGRKTDGRKD